MTMHTYMHCNVTGWRQGRGCGGPVLHTEGVEVGKECHRWVVGPHAGLEQGWRDTASRDHEASRSEEQQTTTLPNNNA